MCAIFYVQYTTYQPPKKNQFSLELIWYFYDFIIIANWLSSDLGLVRSIKTPLDQTHVYSIESEDRLATFAVTRFLYRTIGDGRNTGVLGVLILTMSSEL